MAATKDRAIKQTRGSEHSPGTQPTCHRGELMLASAPAVTSRIKAIRAGTVLDESYGKLARPWLGIALAFQQQKM